MVDCFVHESLPTRVLFGSGSTARLSDELERLDVKRALILCTHSQRPLATAIADLLGRKVAGVFAGAVMHTPVEVTLEALTVVRDVGVDCTVAVGGGSTTGLGKAIALRTDLAQVVIPTTYAGSEMTPILGETEGGIKTTQKSRKVLPEVVIYDVDLTLALPASISATSGMNAIAHAVEALYAKDRNPLVSTLALEGLDRLSHALPRIVLSPSDRDARRDALYGAWLCGICLGSVGMALHHKLCHTLGGMFNLPHAETHAVLLPHALAYTAAAIPEEMVRIAEVLAVSDPAQGLYHLSRRLGAPHGLKDLGMPYEGIEVAADLVVRHPYWNPMPIERNPIRDLLARAWAGEPPLMR